jgi:hypothetical protein
MYEFIEDMWDEESRKDVDGYKTYEVGWMRIAVDGLVPRTYLLLGEGPFSEVYKRPPVVVRL